MLNLINLWNESDVSDVAGALKSLFICQGIARSQEGIEEMARTFCTELENIGIPSPAVLAGINKLKTEEMRSVKLTNIIDASKSYLEPTKQEKQPCELCDKRGLVLWRDANLYQFASACHCQNGEVYRRQGFKTYRAAA